MPSRWNLPALHQFRGARGGQIISTNRWGRGAFRQDVVIASVGPTKRRVRFEELVA